MDKIPTRKNIGYAGIKFEREWPMRVFYKQASQLYSLIYALMLAYKKRAPATPV